MPDTRKKLIELLAGLQDYGVKLKPRLALPSLPCNEIIADHLIANGVVVANPETPTMQQWIPVAERLPETDGWYQVWTKTPFGGFKSFNKASFYNGEWHGSGGRWNNVTHWMPLPQPPKRG